MESDSKVMVLERTGNKRYIVIHDSESGRVLKQTSCSKKERGLTRFLFDFTYNRGVNSARLKYSERCLSDLISQL